MTQVLWTKAFDGRTLAIVTRPRPGEWLEDDIASWWAEGIRVVVSMLQSAEARGLGLGTEGEVCAAKGIDFVSFSIEDVALPPSFEAMHELAALLLRRIAAGERVGLHCRMSIGRSSVVAASVLIESGMTANRAFALVEEARGLRVPDTEEQREWVEQFEGWLRAR